MNVKFWKFYFTEL